MSSIDQQFIEYIVKSLVSNPDKVKIERRIDEKGVLLELSVDPEDLGRVIGKRGATAQSLRTLLRALGTKNDARYNLKIIDTGPPPAGRQTTDDRRQADDRTAQSDAPVDQPTSDDSAVTADSPADEPATSSAADDIDMTDDELPETAKASEDKSSVKEEDHSDVVSRTRKELADLDDLDV